jgi:chromate transporter
MGIARLLDWVRLRRTAQPVGTRKSANWTLVIQLFWSFFKISPVTFGGGYAMIPLIEREVVIRRRWVKQQDVADIFAVSESIPGAIAINSATFIGYRIAGLSGALAAMAGIVLPSFLIVLILSMTFLQLQDQPKVEAAFQGIRATIVALIVYAGIKIGRTAILDKTTLGIATATVVILLFLHVHPVLVIAIGGLAGIGLVKLKQHLGIVVKLDKDEPHVLLGDEK